MELTKQDLSQMAEAYKKDAAQQIAEQAVKNNGIHASSEREHVVVTENNFVFSVDVDSEAVANQRQSGRCVANQRQSGRCWMFSALNFLRFHMEKSLKLPKGSFQLSQNYNFFYDKLEKSNFFMENIIKYAGSDLNDRRVDFLLKLPKGSFQLSQNYNFFYDKLEKSNFFMENIIKYAGSDLNDRRVDFLHATPQQDGGQFHPISALIEKYGVVPLEAMPDTAVTKNTSEFNPVLNRVLREDAFKLRKLVREGKSEKEVDDARRAMLSEIYRILCVSFGQVGEGSGRRTSCPALRDLPHRVRELRRTAEDRGLRIP